MWLRDRDAHVDPDYRHLTYGDRRQRAAQLAVLDPGDQLLFYSGLRDIRTKNLVYAITGTFEIATELVASKVPAERQHENAHPRRKPIDSADLIVFGRPGTSGRLEQCLPIGALRDRAYRAYPNLLAAWGGISSRDGYLQRSARLPTANDPSRFIGWFEAQSVTLLQQNN